MNIEDLAKPFDANLISWRVGATNKKKYDYAKSQNKTLPARKGIALAYIDARDVQDRLDEVCGFLWQTRNPWAVGGKLSCEIGVFVPVLDEGDQWLWRGDGAGDTAVEADKGAFSDAFKRAGVRWGIGRYLYELPNTWIELDDYWSIPAEEKARLTTRLATWQEKYFKNKAVNNG